MTASLRDSVSTSGASSKKRRQRLWYPHSQPGATARPKRGAIPPPNTHSTRLPPRQARRSEFPRIRGPGGAEGARFAHYLSIMTVGEIFKNTVVPDSDPTYGPELEMRVVPGEVTRGGTSL